MREKFQSFRFSSETLRLIEIMSQIIDDYAAMGFDLSLRQLYYQLVSTNVISNDERSYKRVGSILNDARLAGAIDWNSIRDRGRGTVINTHWETPAEIIEAAKNSYKKDMWENQPTYVEVMVEKQALEGVLIPVCRQLDVPFASNKGYSSASAMYLAGKRIANQLQYGKSVAVIYLGDHDPSGIDMTRDVEDRLKLFSRWEELYSDRPFEVTRVALNMDQVESLHLPPNPVKETDSRSGEYSRLYGDTCWELDAINPSDLAQMVTNAVLWHRDDEAYDEMKSQYSYEVDILDSLHRNWDDIVYSLKHMED